MLFDAILVSSVIYHTQVRAIALTTDLKVSAVPDSLKPGILAQNRSWDF